MKIKDKAIIQIEDMTHSGEGVGRIDNMTVFVDGAVTGDEIQIEITTVKKSYMIGKIIEILKASDRRQVSPCHYFDRCGGCQILHINHEEQLALKQKIVKDALERIGEVKDSIINPILGMKSPFRYRNKAQYKISKKGVGFYAKKSHEIVAIDDCQTQPEDCRDVITTLKKLLSEGCFELYNEKTHKGFLRGVVQRTNQKGDNMIILVGNGKKLKKEKEIIDQLIKGIPNVRSIYLNVNTSKGNVILDKENHLLFGVAQIEETIGDTSFLISPNSFFQVNPTQTKVLYDCIKKMADLKGSEILFDLYCGTGTIGLYLAKGAKKVYGIEIVPDAISDAKENAEKNKIKNAEFIQGKSEIEAQKLIKQGINPDIIILDPPRKGCDGTLLEMIETIKVKQVIYVSCNPSTLARDLKILREYGYKIEEIQPVDLFPGTGHVETVVRLSR